MLWSHPRVTASRHPSERPPSRLDQAFDPIMVDQLHGALPALREHLDIRRVRLTANHQPSSSVRRTELHIRPAVRSDEAQQDGFWIWLALPHCRGALRAAWEKGGAQRHPVLETPLGAPPTPGGREPPKGSRLSGGRPARRRKAGGRSPCPPGHNTPFPLERSPPASFKRLLGRWQQ